MLALVSGCRSEEPRTTETPDARSGSSNARPEGLAYTGPTRQPGANDLFVDRAEATGLRFSYFNGFAGNYYFPEMLPGGVALFDYDNDGDLDVYFVQGDMLGAGKTISDATIPPAGPPPLKGRLFRNDLTI